MCASISSAQEHRLWRFPLFISGNRHRRRQKPPRVAPMALELCDDVVRNAMVGVY